MIYGRFYDFLIHQINRNDPIGDLAKDIFRDDNFPISIDGSIGPDRQLLYLSAKGACREAKEALIEAWMEYLTIEYLEDVKVIERLRKIFPLAV
jgi:hypothetical protein